MENHEPHESMFARVAVADHADHNHSPETTSGSEQSTINFNEILQEFLQSRNGCDIEPRELGVVFENLDVVGCGTTASYQSTIGSRFNPLNLIQAIQESRHPPIRNILSNFEGVVRPGEMLLVLGRPGSGCSTLLKVLANRREEFTQITGDLSYDGFLPDEISKHYRGDVQYCPENDLHFPTLTTSQTIRFASRLRAPPQPPSQSRIAYASKATELLMSLFGLQHTKNTQVGDAALRGVSGGEKKRVSICEALATRAQLTSWDNSTRGLDSSTALEFLKTLRGATDSAHLTTIASLYQTGEQIYKIFDKVCVIYEGRMIYFGPAKQARQYFINLGYEPAPRQTTADFLVSVTDPKARICRNPTAPRSALEFATAFLHSPAGEANKEDIATYVSQVVGNKEKREAYVRSAAAEHARKARKSSPYMLSMVMQAKAVSRRSAQIFRGTLVVKAINQMAFTLQALIMGTVFLKVPDTTSSFFSRSGVMYFALLFSALMSMSEIPALFSQRPIILRHRNWGLYHPFIEAVAMTVVDIPVSFLTTVVFGGIIYGLVGLQKTAGQFFTFFVFLLVNALTMKAFFRAVAAACKSEAVAQTGAGISVFFLALYTGYAIPERSMIWALRWITYINPFTYGFEALMVNEFHTLNAVCTNLVPQGPGYENVTLENQVCTTVGAVPGEPRVQGLRFTGLALGYTYNHLWRNLGIVIALGILFALLLCFFTETNTGISAKSDGRTHYKLGTKIEESETEDSPEVEKLRTESRSQQDANASETQMAAQASKAFAREVRTDNVFTFSRVNYTIPLSHRGHGGQTKRLLDDVSGFVAPGKLTALMGETGAGKTTLLNVLAGRTEIGVVAGERSISGHPLPDDFQAQTGYCQQLDTHIPRSTIREALLFSAKLRQPMSVPLKEKEDYVDTLLHICGLWSRRHAIVGSLSLEYSKRTTIAVELAAKPKLLLFCDEPTSGLDTQSAWNIVAFLKTLAEHGLAVLCTIHQPSAELFHFFDTLLLLQNGGQTVYFGDLGLHSETLLQYFAKHRARECHPEENPAEYMLEVIGAGAMSKSTQNWHTVWSKSEERMALDHNLEDIHDEGVARAVAFHGHPASTSQFLTPWSYQLVELVKRGMLDYYRNATYLTAKLTLNVFCGLLIGLSFFKKEESLQGTQNKIFAIFMGIILSVPLAHQLQVPYIATRTVYEIRERPSRIYSWTALITSQIVVEAPWNILGSSLYFLAWYWTAGFPTDRAGYAYLAVGIVFPLYYTTIGQSVACMAPTAEVAGILFGFLFSFVLAFNGVMQPFRALGWWKWMYHVSPYTYLIGGLVAHLMGHRPVVCSSIELVHITPPAGLTCGEYMSSYISYAGGYLIDASVSQDCQFCAVRDSDEFLAGTFNIYYAHRWRDLGVLFAFAVLNTLTIYIFAYLFRFHTGSLFGLKKIWRRWRPEEISEKN